MAFEVPTTETNYTNSQQDFPYTSSSQGSISGFQKLHLVPGDSALGGVVYSSNVLSEKKIRLNVERAGDATLKESTTSVLRWSPAYDEYQTGVGTEPGPVAAGRAKWTSRINFPHAYSEPPQVVTCFYYFNIESNKPWRLTCKATDIDKNGFTAHMNAWGDTVMNGGHLSWFAHPSNRKGIMSGDVSLMDTFRSNGKIYWPSGAFSKKPRICFVGLRYFNSDSSTDGVDFGIDYRIEDDHVKFTVTDKGRLDGASFTYILIE